MLEIPVKELKEWVCLGWVFVRYIYTENGDFAQVKGE